MITYAAILTEKKGNLDLAGVAQWIECQPVNQKVTGQVPRWGA